MPTLCRKMEVPYVIVNNKARLGSIVHLKNTACVAFTSVKAADKAEFASLVEAVKTINENDTSRKTWGGGVLSLKSQAIVDAKRANQEAENARRRALLEKQQRGEAV